MVLAYSYFSHSPGLGDHLLSFYQVAPWVGAGREPPWRVPVLAMGLAWWRAVPPAGYEASWQPGETAVSFACCTALSGGLVHGEGGSPSPHGSDSDRLLKIPEHLM